LEWRFCHAKVTNEGQDVTSHPTWLSCRVRWISSAPFQWRTGSTWPTFNNSQRTSSVLEVNKPQWRNSDVILLPDVIRKFQ